MESRIESITSTCSRERDADLLSNVKSLINAVKSHSLKDIDQDASEWMQKMCSQLTDIIARTDKKNTQLSIRNRIYKNELETLRQSNCLFNSKLY